MGCIKASDYVLAGGSGLILGTYTGPDPSGDCEQDCGICCIPPDNTCWMCDCTFSSIGSTNKLNCIDFVGDNPFYFDEACDQGVNCVLEASIGIGADFWAGDECQYVIYTPEGSEIIHRGSNAGGYSWAYLPDGRLMVLNGLSYPGQPYWTSNDTYMCDCFYGQEVRYDWYDATGRNQETRAFRLWQVDCSGNFTNVTSLYIDSVLAESPHRAGGCFEWDDYNVTDGILTSPIPSGVYVLRPTSKPGIGDCIISRDGDSGYPSYTPVPMPDEFWSLVDGEATICLGREGAPDYTCLPDGSGYCTIDQLPKVDFTCNDTISKSGCISGGVISPSGVAAGTWFAGLNCEVANSGYGGCSGLMQM